MALLLSQGCICSPAAPPSASSLLPLLRQAACLRKKSHHGLQKSCVLLCRALTNGDEGRYDGDNLIAVEYGARILVPGHEEDSREFGEIKLECDDSGCVLVMPKTKTLAEDDTTGYLQCDITGCYYMDEPLKENNFEVIKGQKWCLGYERAPESEDSFSAVLGAGGWSIALTASEFNDFCQLIQTLRKGIATMDEDGYIGKDDIAMQVEKGSVWMECSVLKKRVALLQNFWKLGTWGIVDNQQPLAFELRFVISGSGRRQAEGFWPAEAVMEMLKKIDAINTEESRPSVSTS